MEKNELTRKYELVVIVDAKSTNEAKEVIRKEVTDVINKCGGKVINSQVWLEKHKLTFQIKKCSEGTYYVINFEGQSDIISKIRPILKLNEKILRFDFIKVEPKGTAEAVRA
ncbi:MAG: 30S ribosomal protein S6 [Candidatus Omnitrophica bacterium]|nr:30S ribosomal protein S6 [Candidatus Omnitrophota bacterium]